jgi:hypothetical protein
VNGGGSLSLNHQQPQSAAKFSAAPKSSSSRSTTISGHRPEPALSAAAAADHTKFVCKVQMLDNTVMNVVLSVCCLFWNF